MRRAILALAVVTGCATPPAPPVAEPPTTGPLPAPAAVSPAPSPEPVAVEKKPAPAEPRSPAFEPLELSAAQLGRARKVQPHVKAAAAEYGLDPNLLNGMIWHESKFNPKARNRSGAKGLMQLMPKTAQAMARALQRRNQPYDPEFSIQAGAKLLSILLNKFDGDQRLALFGYARGSGRVRAFVRDGGEIPEGVLKFIAKVQRAQQTFEALGFPDPPAGPDA